jgi:capsular exopolysaccharide synthesis family protein
VANVAAGVGEGMAATSEKIPDTVRSTVPRGVADMLGITAALQIFRRRMLLICGTGLTAALAALALSMLRPAEYTATALLMVTPPQQTTAAVAAQAPGIESELELLRSPALLSELAIALGMQEGSAETGAVVDPQVVASLASAIDVRQRRDTFIVEINAHSGEAERAQLIANTYADVFLASKLNATTGAELTENSWLSRRLAELRQDTQSKEDALAAYRAQHGLDAPQLEEPVEDVASLRAQVQQAQGELSEREARLRQFQELLSSDASIDAIAAALDNPSLNTLRDRRADIVRRQSDLDERYLPSHPAVQAAHNERAEIDAQLERETQRLGGALAGEVTRARARLQSLQQALRSAAGAAQQPASSNSAADPEQLRTLERAAQESREIYESFLERYQQSTDRSQMSTSDVRVLSGAVLPLSPSSPNLRDGLLLMLACGLLFGLGAGLLAELFDRSVKNADDLEAKVGVPAIASIPTISKRMMRQLPPAERHPSGYLVGRPMSAFTEALRVLRTVIVYSKLDFSVKVVAITSALPDEGKTTISMCLARVAAMSGQKVCVVDCDLRKQSINDVIDIETDVGILQVLAGEAPWRSAIVRDPNSEAHVLPVAASGFTPRDVFGSEAMGRLIAELRAQYDLVILDSAPILAVAETRIIVAQADTTVLIARAGRTAIGAMRAAVAQTQAAGGRVLGIALNYVLPRWQSYTDSLYFNESKSYYSVS